MYVSIIGSSAANYKLVLAQRMKKKKTELSKCFVSGPWPRAYPEHLHVLDFSSGSFYSAAKLPTPLPFQLCATPLLSSPIN